MGPATSPATMPAAMRELTSMEVSLVVLALMVSVEVSVFGGLAEEVFCERRGARYKSAVCVRRKFNQKSEEKVSEEII
jgi:hypothetical protein